MDGLACLASCWRSSPRMTVDWWHLISWLHSYFYCRPSRFELSPESNFHFQSNYLSQMPPDGASVHYFAECCWLAACSSWGWLQTVLLRLLCLPCMMISGFGTWISHYLLSNYEHFLGMSFQNWSSLFCSNLSSYFWIRSWGNSRSNPGLGDFSIVTCLHSRDHPVL